MYVLLLVSVIATLLTYLEGNNKLKGGMKWGFLIVVLTAAIRDNYGNDFDSYLDWFTQVTKSNLNIFQIMSDKAIFGVDNGWSLLNYFFVPFGFNFFIAFITLITGIIYYSFIKNNVEPKWRWLAVFIYLFSSQFFVLGLSMMRQSFAMALFVLSYSFIKDQKYIVAVCIMLFATTIHTSALITLPFIFLNMKKDWNHKLLSTLLILIYFGFIVVARYTTDILNQIFFLSSFERFSDNYSENVIEFNLGIGYIVMQLPFLLYVVYAWRNKISNNQAVAILMSSIPYFLLAFKDVAMSERLGYYFAVFSIITLPFVFSSINKRIIRLALLLIYAVVTIYSYNMFFTSPIWTEKFFVYHTIFG